MRRTGPHKRLKRMATQPVIVNDESVYCADCADSAPGHPCGHGHLYVVQLRDAAQDQFTASSKSAKGVLYVGSTGKGVFERFLDNFRLNTGELLDPQVVLANPAATDNVSWKYSARSAAQIRKFYWRHRPDLLCGYRNPIVRDTADRGKLERWEKNLADRLRNRGWHVFGPARDKPE